MIHCCSGQHPYRWTARNTFLVSLDEPLTFHGGFFSLWEKNAKRKEVKARFLENT
jgi:hypothetical protein